MAAGWWRRGCTLVLIVMATVFALFFRYWPEHSVWNTRFLPLYYLCIGFLAAVGAAELMRVGMKLARRAYESLRPGGLGPGLRRGAAGLDSGLAGRTRAISPEASR